MSRRAWATPLQPQSPLRKCQRRHEPKSPLPDRSWQDHREVKLEPRLDPLAWQATGGWRHCSPQGIMRTDLAMPASLRLSVQQSGGWPR